MQKVNFYTKLNCGLCDQGYQMLMALIYEISMEIDVIDITHAHNRFNGQYDERIPVISALKLETELDWPFTKEDIRAYLSQE